MEVVGLVAFLFAIFAWTVVLPTIGLLFVFGLI